jgi:hypothetical protein
MNRRQRSLARRRNEIERGVRSAGRSLESRADELRSDAVSAAEQVTRLI